MSEPAPSCSCRLPWIVVVIALGILLAERFVVPTNSPSAPQPNGPPSTTGTPTAVVDPRLAALQHDLNETRRVLDDAQSALAQRDREIATANDDLRMLRQELDALRAKNAAPTPSAP